MAATFNVVFDNGGTDNTPSLNTAVDALGPPNIRFKQADNSTIDTVNPVPIPAAGTNYSYWKQIYLKCTVAPDTQVDNVRFYTDGSGFGTGITMNVADANPTKNSGSSSGYDVADTAATMASGGHTDVTTVTDAFTFTAGATRTCTISESGSIINATNETCNYIVLQVAVTTSATSGDKANETLTFVYDEI